MRFPGGQTAIVERPITDTDRYGNDVENGWEQVAVLRKVAFAPANRGELRDMGREGTKDEPTLYVTGTVDVRKDDRITVAGRTFQVEGNPEAWRYAFTGRETNTVIRLREVEG